jgi:hypothetical protein
LMATAQIVLLDNHDVESEKILLACRHPG